MNNYCARFYNEVTKEVSLMIEWESEHFTKQMYNTCIQHMFRLACEGIENRLIVVDVFPNKNYLSIMPINQSGVITIACVTQVDGSTITADIYVNGEYIRCMTIAD